MGFPMAGRVAAYDAYWCPAMGVVVTVVTWRMMAADDAGWATTVVARRRTDNFNRPAPAAGAAITGCATGFHSAGVADRGLAPGRMMASHVVVLALALALGDGVISRRRARLMPAHRFRLHHFRKCLRLLLRRYSSLLQARIQRHQLRCLFRRAARGRLAAARFLPGQTALFQVHCA